MRAHSQIVASLALAIVSAAVCGDAMSQAWPQQAVRVIVPFPAGSAVDVAARIIGDGLARRWERPVVIENRPGGETTIGAAAFATASDGHSLLYTTFGTLSVTPFTMDRLPFDPEADLVPLVPTVSIVVAVSVTSSLPAKTLSELEGAIRARPGELAWASAPTLPRYVFATFLKRRGLQMNYVAYREASQQQVDLGEGRIHAFIAAVSTSIPAVPAGKARFIATTEPLRTSVLPEVPSAAEAGYEEFTFIGGAGLWGWKNMPGPIRERVVADVNAVLSEAAVAAKLKATGQQVIGGGSETLAKLVDEQKARVLEISKLIELKSAR